MSTRNVLSGAGFALALSLAASGCSPTLQEGRFTCSNDTDCPGGFVCRASDMLCYRTGPGTDGGVPIDAPSSPEAGIDAAGDAAGSDANIRDAAGDAPVGCGTNCIQLMILNANPGSSGNVEFQDRDGALQRIPMPAYGTTSAVIDVPNVPVGGMLQVNVPPTLTIFHMLPIPTEDRYLLVLGPASLGASVQLLPSPAEGLHTADYVYIRLIDMTVDETVGLLASGAGRDATARAIQNPLDHETISPELPFLPGSTGALSLQLGTGDEPLIAALLADQIPSVEGTYYVVVAGRVREHLDMEEGLRFIPGLPRATALKSSRLVRFVNTIGTNVTVCDGATPLTTVAAGALSLPRVPPASAAWMLSVHTGTDCATGLTHDVTVGPAVGRTLVSIAGDLTSPGTWGAFSISEPRPLTGLYTIVLHNALPASTDIADASAIPSLSTASVTSTTMRSMILANTTDGFRSFAWSPMARQSWAVVAVEAGAYTAHEVDSPFEEPWTLTAVPGT
jgi:hypothetical protein